MVFTRICQSLDWFEGEINRKPHTSIIPFEINVAFFLWKTPKPCVFPWFLWGSSLEPGFRHCFTPPRLSWSAAVIRVQHVPSAFSRTWPTPWSSSVSWSHGRSAECPSHWLSWCISPATRIKLGVISVISIWLMNKIQSNGFSKFSTKK